MIMTWVTQNEKHDKSYFFGTIQQCATNVKQPYKCELSVSAYRVQATFDA